MTTTLITNIGELTTNVVSDGDPYGTMHDAAVLIEDGRIAWVGSAADAPRLDDGARGGAGSGSAAGRGPGPAA
ncbi:imidazolonepropionase-like domain-containing protein, partial [Microbacterium sp. NPDC055357]